MSPLQANRSKRFGMSESGKKLGDASVWVPSWRRREASGTGVDKSNARATRQDSGDSPGAAKQSWRAKSGGSTGSKSTGGLESWSQARVQGQSTSSSTWRQEDGALPSGRHHRRSSGESWGPRSPGGPRSRSQSRTRASSTTSLQVCVRLIDAHRQVMCVATRVAFDYSADVLV